MARTIRPARPDDASALADIDTQVNINPWSAAQFSAACQGGVDTREWALVVEADNRLHGFIVMAQVLDEAAIYNIAVDPAQQRKGLAQSLLTAALAQVVKSGAMRCVLEVRQSNTAARKLYETNGFALDGLRKNYYPTANGREDALLMSKSL